METQGEGQKTVKFCGHPLWMAPISTSAAEGKEDANVSSAK